MDIQKRDKQILIALLICLIGSPIFNILSLALYPPDFSATYPVYNPDGVLVLQFSGTLYLLALTILGMKVEEEKNILAAAGFTAQAISMGLAMVSLFEVTTTVSKESYEKFYYLTVSSNFLYLPAMILIATYEKFKTWIRLAGIATGVPLMVSSIMFMFKIRDYNTLEIISSTGYMMLMTLQLLWAYNIFVNYRKEKISLRS